LIFDISEQSEKGHDKRKARPKNERLNAVNEFFFTFLLSDSINQSFALITLLR